MASNGACTLPYPDRFHAAVNFTVNSVPGSKPVPDELRLVLYALHQQATVGPCTEAKPWSWNVVESAKWESWNQLGNMSSVEAMRLYVRMVEDAQPDWWALAQRHAHKLSLLAADEAEEDAGSAAHFQSPELEAAPLGAWSSPFVEGPKRPPPRYEHAVAAIGPNLYIVGGNCGGRYLGDVWILHMDSMAWSAVSPTNAIAAAEPAAPAENGHAPADGAAGDDADAAEAAPLLPVPLPPCAGHAMVSWGSKLLVLGGHIKAKAGVKELQVLLLDTVNDTWTALKSAGNAPSARGGHSATLIGKTVYVFGGEDASRRPLRELHCLDLTTMAWASPETSGTPPAARSAHVAVAYKASHNRFLVIFGGGSVAHCYNDVVVLDTKTNEWSAPQTAGTPPTPRAGHAAALLGVAMYVAGGGNNSAGCADLVALDLAGLGRGGPLTWRQVATMSQRSPIASEGLSLTPAERAGALVAFGGYNGKYHNAVQVFRPADPEEEPAAGSGDSSAAQPAEPQASQLAARGVANGNGAAPAPVKADSGHLTSKSTSQRLPAANGNGSGDTAAAREEAAAARSEKDAAVSELALTRRQLASAQAAAAEAEAALSDVKQRQEAAERETEASGAKIMRLEVELAEARKALQATVELEKEVAHYRKLAKEAEQNKGKGGIWGYIAGN